MKTNILFLDLEETVFDDLFNQNKLWHKIRRIQHLVDKEEVDIVCMFSFALFEDMSLCDRTFILKSVQAMFPTKTLLFTTTDEIFNKIARQLKIQSNFDEMREFITKETALFHFVQYLEENELHLKEGITGFLVDDRVINNGGFSTTNSSVVFLNINVEEWIL